MPDQALIVVDMQNDFLPGGALGVPDGDAIIPGMVALIERYHAEGHPVVLTRDWHPVDHISFADGIPQFKDGSWPKHCVQNSPGASIRHEIYYAAQPFGGRPAPIFSKGTDKDREAYSGFDGIDHAGRTLAEYLADEGVSEVTVVGLATDYCVDYTASDAAARGFITLVVAGLTRPVTWETGALAVSYWDAKNITTITTDEAMDLAL